MKNTAQENQAVVATQALPRFDMYAGIHKAMRALMSDILMAVGRMDPQDSQELAAVGERVLELLDFCAAHLQHENDFVHTAMEARAPGASARIAHEHNDHLHHISSLKQQVAVLCASGSAGAPALAQQLYLALTLFVAENFQHMHMEETAHNAVLWARYTDAELVDIHNALVASIAPADMLFSLRWLVPYMNPAERAGLLLDMQAHAPAPAFAAALDVVRPHLTPMEWAKLSRALGLPPVPGLVAA
ncbi:hemerythrin domain-containing protein [Rhodoferax sp. AJA081-3]|uniref:hemerythrin domain-containing protein n=1 Tax=Rhodoferax sp. AJA081-3 TaxID=2752316 RepID=UPI001ADF20E9|nr:hemerythrin domain-containing protein [Rhodoferax sp. AJA081-3]QTN26989.1 hemerythrin domain-containing protein [Rhodoferax sp. AJA081-3]